MRLEHIAIWTRRLKELRAFYERYFGAVANEKYRSDKGARGIFESYFLSFDSGARLELMRLDCIPPGDSADGFESTGLTHLALSTDTADSLDRLYRRLKQDGVRIVGEPRTTGDGYYEACVLDPDGNRVEITVAP